MFSHQQYQAVHKGAGLLDRRGRGRLCLTGTDRLAYLQGLLTNDIAALTAGQGCYAALLTAQGRMVSDMRVSELVDRVLIDVPIITSETVRKRLSDFIFSEDVEVTDVQDALAHIALYGPHAAQTLGSVVTSLAAGPTELQTVAGYFEQMPLNANTESDFQGTELTVIRSDDYGVAGFELFLSPGKGDELAQTLRSAGAEDVSLATMGVCRVEAGRPEFGVDMDEHTIPLEAGIEDRAISLTKGCYVGQEVIIRVLHRGHGRIARRLVGFVGLVEDGLLARGERLLADDGLKDVGVVTSAVPSPRLQRPIGLGYVHRDLTAPGTVLLIRRADQSIRRVTVGTVPFIPTAAG
jgi:tRNA-modifying protein YgfZ